MDPQRTLRRLLFVGMAFTASVIALAVLAAPQGSDRPATSTDIATGYSHDQLQQDAIMTQQMSAPNANTGSEYHRSEGQLDRSRNLGYVAALEQHQADIDRMLARNGR